MVLLIMAGVGIAMVYYFKKKSGNKTAQLTDLAAKENIRQKHDLN